MSPGTPNILLPFIGTISALRIEGNFLSSQNEVFFCNAFDTGQIHSSLNLPISRSPMT